MSGLNISNIPSHGRVMRFVAPAWEKSTTPWMLGNSAQRPSAEECLCYQWLQPGRTTLCNVVPMPVLFGLKVWTCELFLIHDI